MLARSKKRSTEVNKVKHLPEKEGVLVRDKYKVDDFVSTIKFICKTLSRLPTGYVNDYLDHRFQGGTIYNNDTLCLIWVEN